MASEADENFKMKEVQVEDMAGVKMNIGVEVNGFLTAVIQSTPEEVTDIFHKLPDLKFREDDIMLCTYQKTGTNWMYEILSMINNRSAERVKTGKLMTMIEVKPQEEMDKLPSPRVMNSHLPLRYLPKDLKDSKVKTVLCCRNPKDTAVSFYNHIKGLKKFNYDGKFPDWLPVFLQGKLPNGKYTDYLKDWEKAVSDGTEFPLHILYYEDFKLNGMKELDKLLKFLEVNIDEQLKKDILDACDFQRMAEEKNVARKELIEKAFNKGFNFFRKGQIGDWKNWFTVAQDEMFDEIWKTEMNESKLFRFRYTDPRAEQNEIKQQN